MFEFLSFAYRRWSTIPDVPGSGWTPLTHFDFEDWNAAIAHSRITRVHGWERIYIYSVIRWVALRTGNRKKRFPSESGGSGAFDEPVPFMVYDEYLPWPIIPCKTVREGMKVSEPLRQYVTDLNGAPLSATFSEELVDAAIEGNVSLLQSIGSVLSKGNKIDPQDRVAYNSWLKEREIARTRLAGPEIKKYLPIVRKELCRLETFWTSAHEYTIYRVMMSLGTVLVRNDSGENHSGNGGHFRRLSQRTWTTH